MGIVGIDACDDEELEEALKQAESDGDDALADLIQDEIEKRADERHGWQIATEGVASFW